MVAVVLADIERAQRYRFLLGQVTQLQSAAVVLAELQEQHRALKVTIRCSAPLHLQVAALAHWVMAGLVLEVQGVQGAGRGQQVEVEQGTRPLRVLRKVTTAAQAQAILLLTMVLAVAAVHLLSALSVQAQLVAMVEPERRLQFPAAASLMRVAAAAEQFQGEPLERVEQAVAVREQTVAQLQQEQVERLILGGVVVALVMALLLEALAVQAAPAS